MNPIPDNSALAPFQIVSALCSRAYGAVLGHASLAKFGNRLLLLGAVLSPQLTRGAENATPYPLTESILTQSFSRLETAANEPSEAVLEALVRDLWIPNTDIAYMALAITEGSFEQATPEAQAAFTQALSEYIGLSYQLVLGQHQGGQHCKVLPPVSLKRGSRVGVKVQLVDAGSPSPLNLSLHWKYSVDTDRWGLYDLSIDGHSVLVQPKKKEWAPILKAQGLMGLTSYLTREIRALSAEE